MSIHNPDCNDHVESWNMSTDGHKCAPMNKISSRAGEVCDCTVAEGGHKDALLVHLAASSGCIKGFPR